MKSYDILMQTIGLFFEGFSKSNLNRQLNDSGNMLLLFCLFVLYSKWYNLFFIITFCEI